jgi:endogenous inhibitor of DNA gyrase (YacG/DUF329 family)
LKTEIPKFSGHRSGSARGNKKSFMRKRRTLRCPTCKTIVPKDAADFPFCSERCRLIDLGKWASGGYVISTPVTDPEELMDIEAKQRREQELREKDSPGRLH